MLLPLTTRLLFLYWLRSMLVLHVHHLYRDVYCLLTNYHNTQIRMACSNPLQNVFPINILFSDVLCFSYGMGMYGGTV